jgi:rod shape-determining protein MreD
MNAIVWQKVDQKVKKTIPFLFTFILVLISIIPIRVPGYTEIAPVLPLISIYHWAIYRPTLLPLWAVFILGFLYDLLSCTTWSLHFSLFECLRYCSLSEAFYYRKVIFCLLVRLWDHCFGSGFRKLVFGIRLVRLFIESSINFFSISFIFWYISNRSLDFPPIAAGFF